MKIIDAALELRKLFPGKHTSLNIEVNNFSHGDKPDLNIRGYHENSGHYNGSNFDDVINEMCEEAGVER